MTNLKANCVDSQNALQSQKESWEIEASSGRCMNSAGYAALNVLHAFVRLFITASRQPFVLPYDNARASPNKLSSKTATKQLL